jgi:HSP20 family protein
MSQVQVHTSTDKGPVARKFANPFSQFRNEMDTLFDKFFSSRPAFDFRLPVTESFSTMTAPVTGMFVPEIDIYESKKGITLRAELPGLSVEDVKLALREGVLTLEGEKAFEQTADDENIPVVECRYGKFQRFFTLPGSVDQDSIKAKFKNGVLTVFMPKLYEKKWPEKRIAIS